MSLHQIIKKINEEFLFEARNSPSLLSDMAAMERYMSESYSGRIMIELLQNSDDAESSKVLITQVDDCIIFANNGRPFNESDILAISRSGASSKDKTKTIGYRGVGFKSSSLLSEDIVIVSNETSFGFSKSLTADALGVSNDSVPTIRVPFVFDCSEFRNTIESLKGKGYTSIFFFKNSNTEVLQEEVNSFSPDLLLFLRNVVQVEIALENCSKTISVERKEMDWGQLVSCEDKEWGIIKNCLAFGYDSGVLTKCSSEEAVYYSFLPTLDKGLFNFKINGNFTTDPSRKHIRLDETTKDALSKIAKAIASVCNEALNSPKLIYKSILSILSYNIAFDPINAYLKSEINNLIPNIQLTCNNGNKIKIQDYCIYPAEYEDSIVRFLRTSNTAISETSLPVFIYDQVDGVDEFLKKWTIKQMADKDLVAVLSDKSFVESVPLYIYSFLLGKVLNAYGSDGLFGKKSISLDKVYFKNENGEISLIKDSSQTSECLNTTLRLNDHNSSFSSTRLKQISQDLGIVFNSKEEALFERSQIEEFDAPPSVVTATSSGSLFPKVKTDRPVIPKWRSAENACIEIERFLGNDAHDVSLQNLGYDIESILPDGSKKYIEVKLIKPSDGSFTITNNEYTAAHQYQDRYYICLMLQSDKNSKAIYIQNPIEKLQFEKRIRQWEWFCDHYEGYELSIDY